MANRRNEQDGIQMNTKVHYRGHLNVIPSMCCGCFNKDHCAAAGGKRPCSAFIAITASALTPKRLRRKVKLVKS